MSREPESASILLVDDGELEEVAQVLEAAGKPFERYRGGQIPDEIAPPEDLLIVTPRRLDRVRRGSPAGARPGYPLRIIAVGEDSAAMRRRLRRHGLHLLVRLPAVAELWQLLIERALYRGEERRRDPRVSVGSPVRLEQTSKATTKEATSTLLLDLSNRGCRLQSNVPLVVGSRVSFAIPEMEPASNEAQSPLQLAGTVRRLVQPTDSGQCRAAIVFDDDLPEATRIRLTNVINHWASGPDSLAATSPASFPALPPRSLPSMPELTLDDETDPPVRSGSEIHLQLEADSMDRREGQRGSFESALVAEGDDGPVVLIGRDLSPGGMRVEAIGELRIGSRFRVALHGPSLTAPCIVDAEVIRDDGDDGFGLAFRDVDPETSHEIEKLVACLPGVESLIEGELANMGAVLSQILRD